MLITPSPFHYSDLIFLRKYKVWNGTFVTHFPVQLLPRENITASFTPLFCWSACSRERQHCYFASPSISHPSAPLARRWHHAKRCNLGTVVTSAIRLLHKSYWGQLRAQGRAGSFHLHNLSYSGFCSSGPFSEHYANRKGKNEIE